MCTGLLGNMREFPSDSKRQGCQLKGGGVRQRVGDIGEITGCERDGESEGLDLTKEHISTARQKDTSEGSVPESQTPQCAGRIGVLIPHKPL